MMFIFLDGNMRLKSIALLFLSFSTAFAAKPCEQQQCVIVIDAGSTGSRLHVYSYDIDDNQTPIQITERFNKKVSPGFATIGTDETNVTHYLDTLFADVPYDSIPTYFYSTAGMRLLSANKQQAYYSFASKWFATHNQFQLMDMKTITGTEEGLFGWLAVNYQLNNFQANTMPVGVMDMGGASVQITFPVTNQQVQTPDIYPVTFNGQHYRVFVKSFLGLGSTEMSHQFLDEPSCFANNYPMPAGLQGKGDAFQCEAQVKELPNDIHQVDKTVQPSIANSANQEWYTIGGLAALADTPLLSFSDKQFTSENLLDQANNALCQKDWKELNANNPTDDYIYSDCLQSAYFYSLLVEGYGISPQKTIHYTSGDTTKDWSLGVVLRQHA